MFEVREIWHIVSEKLWGRALILLYDYEGSAQWGAAASVRFNML